MKALLLTLFAAFPAPSIAAKAELPDRQSLALFDDARARAVNVELHFPVDRETCKPARPCPVAFISPGYGLSHLDYSFIAGALAERGRLASRSSTTCPRIPRS